MPPLPVIPDVYRITLGWSLEEGVRPVNVMHVRTDESDVEVIAESIEEALEGTGNNPFAVMASVYNLVTIGVLPLDGTTPTLNYTVGLTIAGGSAGEILPSSAGVLSISSVQRGPQGRGRLFIGPVGESTASNGLLDGAKLGESRAGWNEVRDAMATLSPPMLFGVCSYTHEAFYASTGTTMRTQIGTQRRRQNQLV